MKNVVISSQGCRIRRDGLLEGWEDVKNIDDLKRYMTQEELPEAGLTFKGGALPEELVRAIFGTVQHFPKHEIVFILLYNPVKHAWRVKVPEQKGTAASVECAGGICEDGYSEIGNIHTHPNMSAFWSGTDHADQEKAPGIYAVIGTTVSDIRNILVDIVTDLGRYNMPVEALFGDVDPKGKYDAPADWAEIISKQAYEPPKEKHVPAKPVKAEEKRAMSAAFGGMSQFEAEEDMCTELITGQLNALFDGGFDEYLKVAMLNLQDRFAEIGLTVEESDVLQDLEQEDLAFSLWKGERP